MKKSQLTLRVVVACAIVQLAAARSIAQSPPPRPPEPTEQQTKTEAPDGNASAESRNSSVATPTDDTRENKLGLALIKNFARDQKAIWTSPAHVRMGDATWLVPFAGLTAGFLVTDRDADLHISQNPTTLRHYTSFSNYGLAGMAGAGAGLYLLGRATHDEHKREAGLLSGEAALDGLFVATSLQYAFGRERPNVDAYRGKFWQGGNSFTSDHATTAWAIASVLSHEYPGPFTKLLVYGAASAITVARIQGKE